MEFRLHHAIQILERTPNVLNVLLRDLDANWTSSNEGLETWSPYDIIGHFIHGELTDWIPRAEIILSDKADKSFTPFDRFAQFQNSKGKTLDQLLDEFAYLRKRNLEKLNAFNLADGDLDKTGIHPDFGAVTLRQLLSTWVVHDLNHLGQIERVMAKQYYEEVGPWVPYLKILQ